MVKYWYRIAILKRARKQAARNVTAVQTRLRLEGASDAISRRSEPPTDCAVTHEFHKIHKETKGRKD